MPDALAEHVDVIQGEVALAAVGEFDLDVTQLHGDVTSVVLEGQYAEGEELLPGPRPAYGDGGQSDYKQLRVVEITSLEGLVPLWHRTYDGNKPDVGMVVAEMEVLRQHVPVADTLVVGDSKLLTQELLPGLRARGWGFLAPLPQNPALEQQYLELPEAGWEVLAYVPQSQARWRPRSGASIAGSRYRKRGRTRRPASRSLSAKCSSALPPSRSSSTGCGSTGSRSQRGVE